jgi:CBS domain containing-hemolysin-like protein
VCSVGLGAVAEPAVAHLFEAAFDALHLPRALLHPVAFVIALLGVSYLHMVIGEMVPKNLALAGPVRAALFLGPPMAAWVRLTRPVLSGLNAASNVVLRMLRIEPRAELSTAYTSSELADMIAESTAEGLIAPGDQQRLARALTLERRVARDVMIPLDRMVTVTERVTPAELERLVGETGYSRFPIRAVTGEFVGFLHAKDILDLPQHDVPVPARVYRPMVRIDADLPLSQTLATLRRGGGHLGRVVDGSRTLGAIALEDVIEEFVGEVHDVSHRVR